MLTRRWILATSSSPGMTKHDVRRPPNRPGGRVKRPGRFHIQMELQPEVACGLVRRQHRQRRLLRLDLQGLVAKHLFDAQSHLGSLMLRRRYRRA